MSVTVETFARALDRAVEEGCRLRKRGVGFDVSSSSGKDWYFTTVEGCTCQAGRSGGFCKHRALVAYVTKRVEEVVPRVSYDKDGADETMKDVLTTEANT